ncbi:hypothetical protein KNV33_gp28 [uncultured phage cr10_1]|uniref:Uncharacterized protein n=1 Tax=uncultured phage cr10_1 TaxID=2772066 RepID=A0A7M1RW73_9CAUD|nr:hypothetical protein KNV33_gp28 [uncultured phage cr10_1]QOR58677.1 hypothetical protein [uncultured phage cr10_1]
MRVGKRVYFDSPQERKEFLALLRDAQDVTEIATIIAKTYKKDLIEAMDIARVYNEFIRKENENVDN